jgi:hypothetical protein
MEEIRCRGVEKKVDHGEERDGKRKKIKGRGRFQKKINNCGKGSVCDMLAMETKVEKMREGRE